MNNTTLNKNNQMDGNTVAAGLALATHISQVSQGINPQSTQTPPQSTQNTPGQSQQPQEAQQPDNNQNDAKFKEMESKMDQMKAEMEAMMQKEVSSVKDIIIEALKEDKQEDDK